MKWSEGFYEGVFSNIRPQVHMSENIILCHSYTNNVVSSLLEKTITFLEI